MLRSLLAVVVLCSSVSAVAQNAEQTLQRKLASIKSFSASFEQQVFDAQKQLLQQGKGELMIRQPALFRFETTEPEPNLFIGDGQSLWFYNEALEQFGLPELANADFQRGKGCFNCMNTGYRGRTGIFEILVADTMVQEMILRRRSAQEITRAAKEAGRLRTLKDDAASKVARGITTLEEAASAVMV